MEIQISKKFTLPELLWFSIPSILMLVLVNFYTMVDGIFVSNYVGSDALSSINIDLPIDFLLYGIGVMFGTGGSAIIGRQLGEGKHQEAKESLSLITLVSAIAGILFAVGLTIGIEPVARLLGASDRLIPYCTDYGRILFVSAMFCILQVINNTLLVTAGKPKLALVLTMISGGLNVGLDYLFIVVMDMGIRGAAWGTSISRIVGGVIPVIYFFCAGKGLCYVKPRFRGWVVRRTITNGSSELLSNLAAAITTFLFNISMMELVGEDGVAAITIILYLQYLFTAIYFGFATSAAPIISYNYGQGDEDYLKKVFRYSLTLIGVGTTLMIVLSILLARPLITVFTDPAGRVYELTYHGYMIFIWNFVFAGFNIFASSMFSAFSNGLISAIISVLRTLVFIVALILILPRLWGIDGLWLSVPLAELLTLIIAIPLLICNGKKVYHYL